MIIGLCGYIGAGKGTVADILLEDGFQILSYADPLKEVVAAAYGWSLDDLKGKTNRGWREKVDEFWAKELGIPNFTPRMALETTGTELFRRNVHNNFWVINMHKRILDEMKRGTRRIVIDDARFENEINLVKQLGGTIIVVDRQDNGREKSPHISNTGWTEFITNDDTILTNTGTIDDLRKQLSTILEYEFILEYEGLKHQHG